MSAEEIAGRFLTLMYPEVFSEQRQEQRPLNPRKTRAKSGSLLVRPLGAAPVVTPVAPAAPVVIPVTPVAPVARSPNSMAISGP